jgi:hypothetical protein
VLDAASLYFGRRLLEIVREKQLEMQKPLLSGQALDFPDYKARAGYLRALSDVVSWMETISLEEETTRGASSL